MTGKDEELQNQIEQTGSAGKGIDAYAYKKVFDALKQEPGFYLPVNFADKVIAKIESRKEASRDVVWIGAGVLSFVIAAIVAIALTNFRPDFGAFKFITSYPGLVIFGAGFILVLQWLDKKFIHARHF